MSEVIGKTAPQLPKKSETEIGKPPVSERSRARRYATMDDVAAMAGVHATTVSLALRSHPSIPLSTRERVLAAARAIGYVQDPLLDAFNFHRQRKHEGKHSLPPIAFVIDAASSAYFFGGSYHPLVYEGVQAAAEAHCLSVEIFPLGHKDMTASRLNTIITSRGISGILLSTFTPTTRAIEFDWEQFSAVKIESHHLLPQHDLVTNDQCQAARLCMRRLRALGYRRIGLATARDDESRLESNFSSGVFVEQTNLPVEECVQPLLFDRDNIANVAAKVEQWILEYKLDAVISNWHELLAVDSWNGESTHLSCSKLRVPHDIAFASLDVPAHAPYIGGVVQNHRLVGTRAMEQLAVLVKTYRRGAPTNPSITYVPGFWRDGATAPAKLTPAVLA